MFLGERTRAPPDPHVRAQAEHRMQKSDAGVGIGTLIGDRDYIAWK